MAYAIPWHTCTQVFNIPYSTTGTPLPVIPFLPYITCRSHYPMPCCSVFNVPPFTMGTHPYVPIIPIFPYVPVVGYFRAPSPPRFFCSLFPYWYSSFPCCVACPLTRNPYSSKYMIRASPVTYCSRWSACLLRSILVGSSLTECMPRRDFFLHKKILLAESAKA